MENSGNALKIRILVREARVVLASGDRIAAIRLGASATKLAPTRFTQINRLFKNKVGVNLAVPNKMVTWADPPAVSPHLYK